MADSSQTDDVNGPSKRTLQIAFLVCDEPAEPTLRKHGGFHDLMHNLLEPLIKQEHEELHLNVKGYDVVNKRQYPTREDLDNVDCVCISGSFVEYAGVDTPWIMRLIGYVVYLHDEFPRIRLVGICFGHQIIARAFGAKVKTGEDTWEIGSTELTLTAEGKKVICDPEDRRSTLRIQQMHSDYVSTVPEGFKLLAKSPRCPVQALVKYYEKEQLSEMEDPPEYRHGEKRPPKPYSMMHIFTCQGHPEWGPDVIEPLIDEFYKDGKIDKELAEEARKNTHENDDSEIFGRALMRQLGIIWTKTREAIESGNVTPEDTEEPEETKEHQQNGK